MRLPCCFQRVRSRRAEAFTIVEALVAITVLMIFAVTSTMTLNFFDERAARNRNAEAARAMVEDYVNYLLNDTGTTYAATTPTLDLDGDGKPDVSICPLVATRTKATTIPLIVKRVSNPLAVDANGNNGVVVNSTLYWRIETVGTTYGCTADTDLLQINLALQYTFHSQTYYYQTMTFKANGAN